MQYKNFYFNFNILSVSRDEIDFKNNYFTIHENVLRSLNVSVELWIYIKQIRLANDSLVPSAGEKCFDIL